MRLQIDVAVNATEAGVIKEFFVSEEDTVTVGQDLVRVEIGGEKPAESEKPKEESAPAPSESKESKPAEPEQPKSEPAKSEKPAPPPQPKEQPEKKSQPEPAAASKSEPASGNREERRVSSHLELSFSHTPWPV